MGIFRHLSLSGLALLPLLFIAVQIFVLSIFSGVPVDDLFLVASVTLLFLFFIECLKVRLDNRAVLVCGMLALAVCATVLKIWTLGLGVITAILLQIKFSPRPNSDTHTVSKLTVGHVVDCLMVVLFAIYITADTTNPTNFLSELISGERSNLDKDEMFFLSVASIISQTGIASTGIDGIHYYHYHNLWPYLIAGISEITARPAFEIYRLIWPLFLLPLMVYALSELFRKIRAPSGSLGLFLLAIIALPLVLSDQKIFFSLRSWLSSPGLLLSFIFLAFFLSGQPNNRHGLNLLLASIATYAKITTGACLFLANVFLIFRSNHSLPVKIYWSSINLVCALIMGYFTLGYWQPFSYPPLSQEALSSIEYIAPRFQLGFFYFSTFSEHLSIGLWLLLIILIGPIALFLIRLNKNYSKIKNWITFWAVSGSGALIGFATSNISYEAGSLFGALATSTFTALIYLSAFGSKLISETNLHFREWKQKNFNPRKIQSVTIALIMMGLTYFGVMFTEELKNRVDVFLSPPSKIVGKSESMQKYVQALLGIRELDLNNKWRVHIPSNELRFWESINDAEFRCLYLPFLIPVLTGLPSIAGYDPDCGEDSIGIPLRYYSSYGYSSYFGKDRSPISCNTKLDGYIKVEYGNNKVKATTFKCPTDG